MKLTRVLAFLIFGCLRVFAGYSNRATLTLPGATGSTQTNFTVGYVFSSATLAVVGSGGKIQNLCSRNGSNVPCDGIWTNDATCATVTGSYTWGYDGDYSSTAGTGHGWLMIPSYTTSALTVYFCYNNTAVNAYQGGAVGAEFDTNTKGVWHHADGTTPSGTDFSAGTACNGGTANITAATGQIDGAFAFSGTSAIEVLGTAAACSSTGGGSNGKLDILTFTYEAWVKSSTTSGDIYNAGMGGFPQFRLSSGNLSLDNANVGNIATSTGTVSTNTWTHVAVTWNNSTGAYVFYINGSASGSGTATVPPAWTLFTWSFSAHTWQMGYFNTSPSLSIDEFRISNVIRSADWIATERANQNSLPSLGSFVALGNCTLTLLGVGC